MNNIQISNYNLYKTLLGGQAFNWDLIDGEFVGFFQDKVIKIKLNNNKITWETYSESNKNDSKFLTNYLFLNQNYDEVLSQISTDEHVKNALEKTSHVRILKQDFEQTLLSFILTSHKNIKAVRKVVRDLSRAYGKDILVDNKKYYFFPNVEDLKKASEKDLRNLGLGFRAKYFKEAVERLEEVKVRLKKVKVSENSEVETREILTSLNGVGDKIADCVMVFALKFYSITPIDIWGKRVLTDLYGVDNKLKYKDLRRIFTEKFGNNTAFAGQILFEYLRENYNR